MNISEVRNNDAISDASVARVDMKLEVVVIPVSDVDRAKEFYGQLGWRLDADSPFDNGFQVVSVHAARLGVLGPIRHEHDVGRTGFGPRSLPDRL